jgi:hypothetical protein
VYDTVDPTFVISVVGENGNQRNGHLVGNYEEPARTGSTGFGVGEGRRAGLYPVLHNGVNHF